MATGARGRAGRREPDPGVMRGPVAVLWSAGEAAAAGAFSLTSAFIVARIVGPAELGIGAAAVSLHILFWVGVNAFFADAMVQRTVLEEDAAASAFWASASVGLLAGIVQAGLGFVLAPAMGDPRLLPMALLLGAALPLVGAAGAVQGRLTRERRYRLLACRTLVGQGAGTITGISCALIGAGAWAVVAQQAVTSLLGAVVLLISAGWRPPLVWRKRAVMDLIAIGGPLTASTLVLHGRYRVFAVLIGSTAGAAALGEVHLAFRLVDTVRELASTALWRLMLPAMSERQTDRLSLLACTERWLAASGMILFPLCAAMVVSVGPMTQLLLGPAWSGVSAAAIPLVILAAWSFLAFPAGVTLVAVGTPGVALRANIASSVLLLAGTLVFHPTSAQQAVWLWLASQSVIGPYTLPKSAAALKTSVWKILRAGIPILGISIIAATAAVLVPSMFDQAAGPTMLLVHRLSVLGLFSTMIWLPVFRPVGIFGSRFLGQRTWMKRAGG